jgi:GxxExxY protein
MAQHAMSRVACEAISMGIGGIPLGSCVYDLLLFYHGEKQEGHGGPQESERMLIAGELTEEIIGLAIEVHRNTGRGLLESAYEQCLCHELRQTGIACERQVLVPVMYKGMAIGDGFRADIVVAGEVILEIKAVAAILPAHEAQLHTYLSMSGLHVGLILNFNARRLTDGIRRTVL